MNAVPEEKNAQPDPVVPPAIPQELLNWAVQADKQLSTFIPETLTRLQALEEARSRVDQANVEKIYRDLLATIHGYGNLIMAIGYGGIIAIWSQSAKLMPPAVFAGAGALVLFSLLLFIGAEVLHMHTLRSALKGPPHTWQAKMEAAKEKVQMHARMFYWPTLISGFAGGAAMFAYYAGKLLVESGAPWG